MGIISSLLSAIGCGSSSRRPTLADYDVTLHPQRALRIDPAVATNGRFELVAGEGLVVELHTVRGKSRIARDTASDWTVVIELPPSPDPAGPHEVTLDGAPSVMRVAGEDVLYLARGARGWVKLARTSAPASGELELVFEAPDRDLIQLGPHRITGAFQAKVK